MPGAGTKLPNGLIVGKDFKITKETSVNEMMQGGGKLNYDDYPLAVELKFGIGDWMKQEMTKEDIEEIKSVLEEFNTAMPFTQNRTIPYQC